MGGPSEPLWTFGRREKSLVITGIRTPGSPAHSLVATRTTPQQLLLMLSVSNSNDTALWVHFVQLTQATQ